MDSIRVASTLLAALELVPGEPWDLTEILRNPAERAALLTWNPDRGHRQLTDYLLENLDIRRVDHWEKRLEQLTQARGVRPLVVGDPDYPDLLQDCWDAPPLIFVRGIVPIGCSLAIVGSRRASDAALTAATEVAAEAASEGIVVISGLAAGVDAAAHKGALIAGGQTVAVMGTGIEQVFPVENASLAEEIVASGAVLSQFAPDAPRTGTTFLRRNRIIAGLAHVSLVMEGLDRSGSRHEAEQALSYGRQILFWRPTMNDQQWARELVSSGAATFVSAPRDVMKLTVGSC